jgi:hypothetical protein
MKSLAISFVVCLTAISAANAQDARMSFFVTSQGPGDGANLGGLAGADAHCQRLAQAAGVTGKTWRAYLSTATVSARSRIGQGPWYNAKGVLIAKDIDSLHGSANAISKATGLSEKGMPIKGRGDQPNMHDILTGSNSDGTAFGGDEDHTCSNWTSNAGEGSAQVGHHDRQGGGPDPTSWNSAHGSRGCGQADLQGTGGNGLFYCFATD